MCQVHGGFFTTNCICYEGYECCCCCKGNAGCGKPKARKILQDLEAYLVDMVNGGEIIDMIDRHGSIEVGDSYKGMPITHMLRHEGSDQVWVILADGQGNYFEVDIEEE